MLHECTNRIIIRVWVLFMDVSALNDQRGMEWPVAGALRADMGQL